MSDQLFSRLKMVFEDIFIDEYELSEFTTADDIDEWDSMAHMNLTNALEEEFKIKFNLEELADAKNIGEMLLLIKNKIS
jgi:acyl carrier protein